MFGNVISVNKTSAIVALAPNVKLDNDLINLHLVFEEANKKILGEIDTISSGQIKVNFIGEFVNDSFIGGVLRKPSFSCKVRVINKEELDMLVGQDKESIPLGVCPIYNNYPLYVKVNDLFAHHTAIFGNSGSGKTYGICRIIQNLFRNTENIPFKANFFIFDSYGEYISAFKDLNKVNPNYNLKVITTNTNQNYELLNIPVNLLTTDDLLNLLDATEYCQISIIESALNLTKIFARKDKETVDYQNYILAKAINSLLYSNQTTARIRDQIFEIISTTYTDEINLNVNVQGIGFSRKLDRCFEIDSEGRFAESKLIYDFIGKFIDESKVWNLDTSNDKNLYTLKDFEKALNFTLFSEKYLLNEKMYNAAVSLKVKLSDLINNKYSKFFTSDKFYTMNEYMSFLLSSESKKCQIVNINLEDVDDRFARSITKIFSRLFLKFNRSLSVRASFPIHIILEEAHRYVVRNDDKDIIGYNIFERIAKEGRKYGLILDLITQRPTELNEDVISQCSNFLTFKITHPTDLEYINKMVPNMSEDIVEKQKNLQAGTCVAFGRIFKIPMICKMEKASPAPESDNADIYESWMIKVNK